MPLKLPFELDPIGQADSGRTWENFKAMLKYVEDLNTAVETLTNLTVTGNFNNTDKLSTTSSGVTIPGILTNTGKLTTDASGNVLTPNQPGFHATYDPGGSVAFGHTGKKFIIFETEIIDVGSCYNHTTGVFTAPVAGKYFFTAMFPAITGGGSASTNLELDIVTGGGTIQGSIEGLGGGNRLTLLASGIVSLTAGQTARVQVTPDGSTATFLQPLRIIYDGLGIGDVCPAVFTGCLLG